MNIIIHKITSAQEHEIAWAIRRKVFVEEQECPEELEWEYEEESVHYLAVAEGVAVGTARIRETEKGLKFERFAVLIEARGKGVGSALVAFLLNEVSGRTEKKYLHAQLSAAPLYAKHGFTAYGEHFWEAGIEHIAMAYTFKA